MSKTEIETTRKPCFKIGQEFIRPSRKHKYVETVTDILTTTNAAGEVINIRYVTSHLFCGQIILDRDVLDTTIARSLVEAGEVLPSLQKD